MTERIVFGDFQTPTDLADAVCFHLLGRGVSPELIIEPTCGRGTFLAAASRAWKNTPLVGVEINPEYIASAKQGLDERRCVFRQEDAFQVDWEAIMQNRKTLFIGNPPWVTNSAMSSAKGSNLPAKTNFQNRKGLDAITGSANFDISEWFLLRWLRAARSTSGSSIAMLCKTAVARKLLTQAWEEGGIGYASIHRIDALKTFGAAVDACLFYIEADGCGHQLCEIFDSLSDKIPQSTLAFETGRVISDLAGFRSTRWLMSPDNLTQGKWRSGIKHDCSSVMELTEQNGNLINGLGELVEIEQDMLFALLKSSDISSKKREQKDRCKWVIVPQRRTGEDTEKLREACPRAYRYLSKHKALLDARKSSIYKKRPSFSIFGVGDYSFAPYKVAISGLYKSLKFSMIGPKDGRPIMLDDTCYFLPFQERDSALQLCDALNGSDAQLFLRSMIFWDAKRPITSKLLSTVNLAWLVNGRKSLLSAEIA